MLPSRSGPDPATTAPDSLRAAWADSLPADDDGSVSEAISLERVGRLVAADHHLLDADAAAAALRDRVIVEMIDTVIDAETLADRVPLDVTPQELKARLEGEAPMTLYEYAHLRHAVATA